jgi:hypothetical protein
VCYKYAAATPEAGPFDWGYSSVGRASRSHREGQGFESPYLHYDLLRCSTSEMGVTLAPRAVPHSGRHPTRMTKER